MQPHDFSTSYNENLEYNKVFVELLLVSNLVKLRTETDLFNSY